MRRKQSQKTTRRDDKTRKMTIRRLNILLKSDPAPERCAKVHCSENPDGEELKPLTLLELFNRTKCCIKFRFCRMASISRATTAEEDEGEDT